MTATHTSVVDLPVAIERTDLPGEKDLCGILPYATALKEFIQQADTPLTIALQGEWGSGKTSLMHFLKHFLVDTDAIFYAIEVNTWQHSMLKTPGEAIVGILQSIIHDLLQIMGENTDSAEKKNSSKLQRMLKILAVASANVAGNLTGAGMVGSMVKNAAIEVEGIRDKVAPEQPTGESLVAALRENVRGVIDEVLEKHREYKGFIFFIDDLDRIDPPLAVQLLELLKNIFDLEHCIYILAIDYDVVVKGLKPKFGEFTEENAHEFRSFFDKIIQLPFKMPISSYKLDGYLGQNLKHIGFLTAEEEQNHEMIKNLNDFAIRSVGLNPRSLKRLTNILSLINLMTRKTSEGGLPSLDKQIHFALVCLQIAYPQIYDLLAEKPNFLKWTPEDMAKYTPGGKPATAEDNPLAGDPWEQALSLRCQVVPYLVSHEKDIRDLLGLIADLIPLANESEQTEVVGNMIEKLIHLSDVTNVKATVTNVPAPVAEDFNYSYWLKEHRWVLLPLVKAMLPEGISFENDSGRVVYSVRYRITNKHYPADYPHPPKGLLAYVDTWTKDSRYYMNFRHDAPYLWYATEPDRLKAEENLGCQGCMDKVCQQIEELKAQYSDYKFEYAFNYVVSVSGAYSFRFTADYSSPDEMVSKEAVEKYARALVKYLAILQQLYPVMIAKER